MHIELIPCYKRNYLWINPFWFEMFQSNIPIRYILWCKITIFLQKIYYNSCMAVNKAISNRKAELIEPRVNNCEGDQKKLFSLIHSLLGSEKNYNVGRIYQLFYFVIFKKHVFIKKNEYHQNGKKSRSLAISTNTIFMVLKPNPGEHHK